MNSLRGGEKEQRKADVTWHKAAFWIRKILPREFPEQKETFKCTWNHWWTVLIFYKCFIVFCRSMPKAPVKWSCAERETKTTKDGSFPSWFDLF